MTKRTVNIETPRLGAIGAMPARFNCDMQKLADSNQFNGLLTQDTSLSHAIFATDLISDNPAPLLCADRSRIESA